MIREVQNAVRRHALLQKGDHVVLAVSGGADSICLLTLFARLQARLGIRLTVAHLNHRLRRKASETDAAFVASFAESLNVPVVIGHSDVRRLARQRRVSIEMAAREARYAFLARVAGQCAGTVVATAHTASDQAETVLLKLMRGAGPRGLSGIPRKTCINGITVVRPLLDLSGESLRGYLRRKHVEWREDASNAQPDFLRNRVRHELLPLIAERFNPNIEDTLCRTAEICGWEDAWLDTLTNELMATSLVKTGRLMTVPLRAQPLAARRRIVRSWLVAMGVSTDTLDYTVVDRILHLAESGAGSGEVPLKAGRAVVREYDALALTTGPAGREQRRGNIRVRLANPGETLVPELDLRVLIRRANGIRRDRGRGVGVLPAFASLSREQIGRKALYVRTWSPGDRIRPMGMKGSRKLQDVFVDAKTAVRRRNSVPVFVCGGEIIWIPGYRVARGWGVARKPDAAIQIDVEHV